MFVRPQLSTLTGVIIAFASQTLVAGVIVDDHFTGNSGGVPADWNVVANIGSIVESGTAVILTDTTHRSTAIGSKKIYNPQITTTTAVVNIAGFGRTVDGEQATLAFAPNPFTGTPFFEVSLWGAISQATAPVQRSGDAVACRMCRATWAASFFLPSMLKCTLPGEDMSRACWGWTRA